MAHYVEGFVIPVSKKNVNAYRRMAQKAGKIWREHGALEFRECVGDDLNVKMGEVVSTRDQSQTCRDCGFFVDRLPVACTSRPRERQGHERSAFREDAEGDAFRYEAHALRRIQDHRRSLSALDRFGRRMRSMLPGYVDLCLVENRSSQASGRTKRC